MIVPDVNLLVYAYDELSPRHAAARTWWEGVLSAADPVGIPWVVVLAFTRLATHSGISKNPLTVAQVRRAVESWLALEHVRCLSPSVRTFDLFYTLLEQIGTGGNLSTDAMIAALAMEHGGVVYSNDEDFNRFSGLSWHNPLKPAR